MTERGTDQVVSECPRNGALGVSRGDEAGSGDNSRSHPGSRAGVRYWDTVMLEAQPLPRTQLHAMW